MSDLDDALADLAAWLPRAQALTAIPDTAPANGTRSQPGSRPPWNAAAANALYDALEGIRRLETSLRWEVTGRDAPPPHLSHAGPTLAAIGSLAEAIDERDRSRAAAYLVKLTTPVLQLAAVDEEERPQRVPAPCPYCGFVMLRVYPRSGRVACVRAGACADSDGNTPQGRAGRSPMDGTPRIEWNDGLVT